VEAGKAPLAAVAGRKFPRIFGAALGLRIPIPGAVRSAIGALGAGDRSAGHWGARGARGGSRRGDHFSAWFFNAAERMERGPYFARGPGARPGRGSPGLTPRRLEATFPPGARCAGSNPRRQLDQGRICTTKEPDPQQITRAARTLAIKRADRERRRHRVRPAGQRCWQMPVGAQLISVGNS